MAYNDKVISVGKTTTISQENGQKNVEEKRGNPPTAFVSTDAGSSRRPALSCASSGPFCVADAAGARRGDARTVGPAQLHACEMEMGGCGREREASGGRM